MRMETPKKAKTSTTRPPPVEKWAVQCGKCFKWRIIPNQEEFEEIRSKFVEDPFFCEKKTGISCDDPADIEYNSSRTWVIDKPNLPKTPAGFKKRVVVRKDHSRVDVHYVTPTGKKLRATSEVAMFLQENPEFSHLTAANFSFASPKIMEDTIPDHVERKSSAGKSIVLGSA